MTFFLFSVYWYLKTPNKLEFIIGYILAGVFAFYEVYSNS
jgi:hypothetical protein